MPENAPFQTLALGDLTLEGFSRAAVQTYWRIPELKIGFDLGGQPWDFMGTPTWFISHTHLDHVAALPVLVARRRMMKMDPPTIYLPAHAVPGVEALLKCVGRLDRSRMPCRLEGVEPGQEISLHRDLVVTAHATRHTVPSLGYVVWQRRHKLKEEYLELPGEQIRDLRLQGIEITHEVRVPWFAYVGDSAPAVLDEHPAFLEARYLLSEMTFVARRHRRERIHKSGHMHLDDYLERRDRFHNEKIVVAHFSTRYDTRQIAKMVDKALPDRLQGRLHLWL